MSSRRYSASARVLSCLMVAIALAASTGSQGQMMRGSPAPGRPGARPQAQPPRRPAAAPQPPEGPRSAPAQGLTPEQQQRLQKGQQQQQQAQTLAQQGKFPEAIAAAEAGAAIFRGIQGTPRPELAQTLDLLARIHAALGDTSAEIRTRRELVDVLIRLFRESDWRVTDARLVLADRQRILAMGTDDRRRIDEANRVFARAADLAQAGRIEEAIAAETRARDLFRDALGPSHRDVATCDVNLGRMHSIRKDYAQARTCYERAIRLRRSTLGEDHLETVDALSELGQVAEAQGDLIGAKVFFEQAITHRRQAVQGDDEAVAQQMENLARLLEFQGDQDGARIWLEQATRIRQVFVDRTMAAYELPGPLMGRGNEPEPDSRTRERPDPFGLRIPGLGRLGDGGFGFGGFGGRQRRGLWGGGPGFDDPTYALSFTGPRQSQEDEMAMATQPTHPWTLRARAKLMLDHEMRAWAAKDDGGIVGETVRALQPSPFSGFGRRAGPSFRGEQWITYARTLGRLAGILRDQGARKEARLLQLAALRVGLEATDIEDQTSPQFADFVDQFIDVLQEQGELPLCQSLAHEMVLLRRRDFGPKHPSFAAGLETLAQVLWARGDHTQATLLLEKAVAIRRAAQGDAHPDLNDLRYRLALLHRDRGELDEARQVLVEALDQYESFVFSAVPFLPERERLALMARFSRTLSAYLDFSTDDPRQVEEAYRRLLAWKGTATAVATAQRASMATPELRASSEELGRVRDDLNRLYYAQVAPEQAGDHARRLREQLARRSELESSLARSIGWSRRPIGIAEVGDALPPGSALVDLFRYMHHVPATDPEIQARNQPPFITSFRTPPTEGPGLRFEAHYVAFVVRPGRSVARIDAGRAEPPDQAVLEMVDQIENDRDFAASASRLSRAAWEPLAVRLAGADWILIAPDGALSFLPWAALPGRWPGTYLLEEHGFGLITAARQLVESPPGRPGDAAHRLLVVGGVDYDRAESGDAPAPAHPEARSPLLASATTRAGAFAGHGLKVDGLPGTLAEARQVAGVFRAIGPGRLGAQAIRFDGARATKPRVRAEMAEKTYLHLATHGYFAGPKFASALAPGTLKVAGRSREGADRSEVHGLYPGLLSGLVWAGANRPEMDPVTGAADLGGRIMTAEEVAGLDLTACELAVLSACETGRGQVAGGEGVIGLQRAFHEAGARRVVASLWKVDDEATRALMERFYTFLWRDRLDPLQALHAAQLELLRGGSGEGTSRELGRPEGSRATRIRRSDSPRHWAAWLISGRPGGDSSGSIRWHPSLPPGPRRFLGIDRRTVPAWAALLATLLAMAILGGRRIRRGRPARP